MTTKLALCSSCLAAVVLLATAAAPLHAADGENHPEIGIQGGFFLPDKDLSGKSRKFDEIEPQAGIRFGYLFAKRWGWFVDGLLADFNTNRLTSGDADTTTARTGIELMTKPHWEKRQWFVGLGVGWMDVDLESEPDFDRTLASLSLGQRYRLDERTHLRWELRGDHTLDDDGLGAEDLTRAQFLLGVNWGLGIKSVDSDGDGVRDARDDCPNTPRGAVVDARGCPKDSDGDGVFDGIDKCPDTPRGATVDSRGCSDSDGDGVTDGDDECPDTPRGATVDSRGCPKDSDGDGVFDGIDKCPDTPRGVEVDSRGCPKDSDGDGVFDGIDKCPDTPRGVEVDSRGCPKDSDGDGVFDGIDKCPDTPRGTAVRPDGCERAKQLFEEEKRTLILEGVNFELNSDVLVDSSVAILETVAQSLRDWPEVRVEVAGHTDSTGTAAYNLNLSTRRAESVRRFLTGLGVANDQLTTRGYGESLPMADNGTKQGRAKNRRVELKKVN